jgi:polyketide cyclase/dehydrase/lipid transport protein
MKPFHFDRTWDFAVPPQELWTVATRTRDYRNWWTWLRDLDGPGVYAGAQARCVIQSPLPYALRLHIDVERAEPPAIIETYVRGDLDGPARLEIDATEHGSRARLAWELEVCDRVLRQFARVARPVMVWAHDRVVATGVDQFRVRALNGHR